MLPVAVLYVYDRLSQHEPRPEQTEAELLAERAIQHGLLDSARLGEVKDPKMARPPFEGVSGVSTGSFIAPFAFLGTDADYAAIDDLFRNSPASAPTLRGNLFFLPSQPSLADMSGIEHLVEGTFDLAMARRIVDAAASGRRLLVQTASLDDGSAYPFEFDDVASDAVEAGDPGMMHRVLLASAGMPGVFPSREIEGALFADGCLIGNILYGGSPSRDAEFGANWRRLYPETPAPTMRYWVVLNGHLAATPRTIQPT